MKQNLLELIVGAFPDDVISQASAVVGESEKQVKKSLPRLISLVLSSLIRRAEMPDGPAALWTLTHEATDPNETAGLLTAQRLIQRTELMQGLLGQGYDTTVSRLAEASGLRVNSVSTLLSMVAQASLHSLGTHATAQAWPATTLTEWLRSQKEEVMYALMQTGTAEPRSGSWGGPATLPHAPVDTPTGHPASSRGVWANVAGGHTYTPVSPPETNQSTWRRYGGWAILLVLVGAALEYFFMAGRPASASTEATPVAMAAPEPRASTEAPALEKDETVSGRYDAESGNFIYDPGRPITLVLADGSKQTVGINSTESRLYAFLTNKNVQVDSVNRTKGWINFDRVYFDARKATLTDESRGQLRNIVSILRTFPNAHIKIGGYTDSTGVGLENLKLSQARADVAMMTLAEMGIDINRLETKGYGVKHNIFPNTTPTGRALNRRISLRVTRK